MPEGLSAHRYGELIEPVRVNADVLTTDLEGYSPSESQPTVAKGESQLWFMRSSSTWAVITPFCMKSAMSAANSSGTSLGTM